MARQNTRVIKSDGSSEQFDFEKLEGSLRRAGATEPVVRDISEHIGRELADTIGTNDIYRHAFAILKQARRTAAARYSLKRALIELGPTGFPFERFVAEIFKARGFKVSLEIEGKGRCIEHELDLVAWNERSLILAEAKFHNTLGTKSDAKVALYVKARFDDLKETDFLLEGGSGRRMDEGWLITNTKFTTNAVRFGECAGLTLVGWNYPAHGNLNDLITEARVHPITCLTSLSSAEKKRLLEQGIVLCRELREETEKMRAVVLPQDTLARAREEAVAVCSTE